MHQSVFDRILALASEEAMGQETTAYLAAQLGAFVLPGEPVLVCLEKGGPGALGCLMEAAVAQCGGRCVAWGEDRRWKTLLRLAFSSRATTIIGTPRVILGLCKLKKAMATPLYIRNVVTAGYPCRDWMADGISRALDCRIWCSLDVFATGVVAGFSCGHGVHLRESAYKVDVVDEGGKALPAGTLGRWQLAPVAHPELAFCPGEWGRMDRRACPCGRPGIRLVERRWDGEDRTLAALADDLLSWTSVLDFTLRRGKYGLELELLMFPGEKLPPLPNCARQVVRPWNPEVDEPFPDVPKNIGEFADQY